MACAAVALSLASCNRSLGPTAVPPEILEQRQIDLGTEERVVVDLPGVTVDPASLRASSGFKVTLSRSALGLNSLIIEADRNHALPLQLDKARMPGRVFFQVDGGTDVAYDLVATRFDLSGKINLSAATPRRVVGADARFTPHRVHLQGQSAPLAKKHRVIARYFGASAADAAAQRPEAAARMGQETVVFQLGSAAEAARWASRLSAQKDVRYATVDAPLQMQQLAAPLMPSDQYAPLQWEHRMIGMGAVWRQLANKPLQETVVAVLDSGTRYDHPDLSNNLLDGAAGALDFTPLSKEGRPSFDADPTDEGDPANLGRGSHGTHVSGIVAANWGENSSPVGEQQSRSGIAGTGGPSGAVKVLPLRVISAEGIQTADVMAAVLYAAGEEIERDGQRLRLPPETRAKVKVLNLSLGGPISKEEAQPLCDAVEMAASRGLFVVVSAGNYGGSYPEGTKIYPAACVGAVAVGSVAPGPHLSALHSDFSSAFDEVFIAAPGGASPFSMTTHNGATLNGTAAPDQIFSTNWNYADNRPEYNYQSGTSQAAPQVSAIAALMFASGQVTSAAELKARMAETALDLGAAGRDAKFGHGLINPPALFGAPSVTSEYSVQLRGAGRVHHPPIDGSGRWRAHVGEGKWIVEYKHSVHGGALATETIATQEAEMGPQNPSEQLPSLSP